jgi:hypothetical protein
MVSKSESPPEAGDGAAALLAGGGELEAGGGGGATEEVVAGVDGSTSALEDEAGAAGVVGAGATKGAVEDTGAEATEATGRLCLCAPVLVGRESMVVYSVTVTMSILVMKPRLPRFSTGELNARAAKKARTRVKTCILSIEVGTE